MIWNRNKNTLSYIHRCDLYRNEYSDADWEGRIRIIQDKLNLTSIQANQSKGDIERRMVESQRDTELKMIETQKNIELKIIESQKNIELKMEALFHKLQISADPNQQAQALGKFESPIADLNKIKLDLPDNMFRMDMDLSECGNITSEPDASDPKPRTIKLRPTTRKK